jgi:NADP-dependent 3-hydroxy acid dehydrogenase YdfG
MTNSFTNQVAVVTGASSGIGRALAIALAAEGAAVFLAARRAENLQAVAKTIQDVNDKARVWVCPTDLCKESDIDRLRSVIERDAGSLDILVHSGGAYGRGAMNQVTAAEFDELYAANVRGPFLLTNAVLPMLQVRKGQIVFINSSVGLSARAGVGQFSATQHALRAVANAFREEVNLDGIRVLNMHLGRTATPRIQALYERDAKLYRPEALMQPEDVAAMAVAALRLPRTAEVTEIHMRPLAKSY